MKFVLALAFVLAIGVAQTMLVAHLAKARHRGFWRALGVVLLTMLVSGFVSALFGRSWPADVANVLVGAWIFAGVLGMPFARALAASVLLHVVNLVVVFLLTGHTQWLIGGPGTRLR